MHPLVGALLLVERPATIERLDLTGREGVHLKVRSLAERARGVME